MVEKMKKYSFLIYYKTYNEFLESIRNAGVVHIVEKQEGIPDHAKDLHKQLAVSNLLKNTIRSLQSRHGGHKSAECKPMDSTEVLTVYEQLEAQKEQLKRQRRTLRKDICQMSIWGYFDPETIRKIKQAGYHVEFYSCHENEFKTEWIDKFNAMEIAHASGFIYFITITLSVTEEEEPAAEKTSISDRCIIQLRAELQENIKQAAKVEKQLDLLAVEHLDDLIEAHRKQLDSIDLNKVNLQAERKADENLILLEGWVPEAKEPELISALETQDVYYTAETPAPTDNTVPVLLKNNKFARLFEPIGKLYDLPNYHEIDVTPFFAPFYLLFFGICLGDAGYGLLLLIATLIARRKVKPSLKPIMSLAAVLGAGAVICGILTGTLFGIELLKVKWAWLTSFQKLMVDTDQMFYIALILGAIQIIFAMFIKAVGRVIRFGWAYSLESWGWLILITGGGSLYYFAYQKEMLPPDLSRYLVYGVLSIAALFILILNTPGRNPLINFGAGLWNSYNFITGIVSDLLSYIRLFALCLCGAVMGLVFNDLALTMKPDIPVVGHLLMFIILILGHSINIFMSGLGAFIHSMRLTFVEFYKNVGYQGRGKAYNPLKVN